MTLLRPSLQEAARPARIRGLGGSFTPEPATGGGSFTVPLDLPPGPGGIAPSLALRYVTGAPNGPFGAGFAVPLPNVRLDDSGTQSRTSGRLARRGEGFVLTARSGTRHFLGTSDGGRSGSHAWHLERTEDALGNSAAFGWAHHSGQAYLARISYGPYEVDFAYEPRPDVLQLGRVTTALRCSRIELRLPAAARPLVRRWTLGYDVDDGASVLTSVALTGYDARGAEAAAPVLRLAYARSETPAAPRVQLPARARTSINAGVLLLDAEDEPVPYYSLAPGAGRLSEIDNGIGLRTAIEYTTVETVPVVRRVVLRESATGLAGTTEFEYHERRFGDAFTGFGRVVQDELGDEHAPTLRTVRWFGDDGFLRQEETYGLDDSPDAVRPYRRVEHAKRPQWTRSVTTVFERQEKPVSVTTTESDLDAAGNPVRVVETTERPGHETSVRETRTTYATDPDHRFAALPARVRELDGDGKVLSDKLFRYDEGPDGSAGSQGLLTAREELVLTDELVADVYGPVPPDLVRHGYHRRAGEAGWWVTTFHRRADNVTGLRTTTTGSRGDTHEVRYSDDRCFPEVATDPVGNVTATRYDVRTARVCEVTDPAGAVTTVTHDPLGRPETVVRPGDTADLPTLRHRYDHHGPVRVTTEQRAVSGEAEVLTTVEVRDGAGRLLQRRHTELLGDVVDEHHEYCARGLVCRTSRAFRIGGRRTPAAEYRYDALGRPLRVTAPDGTVRTFDAGSAETEIGEVTCDLLGRVLRGADGVAHVRDAAGNAVESRSEGGRAVYRIHDVAGRVAAVLVDDPDSAPVTTFTYHDGGLPVPLEAGPHSCGRLVRVTDESGVTLLGYDALGHPISKRWRPAHVAVEYRLDIVRRADGRLSEVTYPDAGDGRLTVRYQYDEVSRLVSVPDFVDSVQYDVRGRRTAVHYANGVTEAFSGRRHVVTGPGGWLREIEPPPVAQLPKPLPGIEIRDVFGRLRGIHGDDGVNELYGYDHSGRRVRTLVSSGTGVHEVLSPDDLYSLEDGERVIVVADAVRQYADGTRRYLHIDALDRIALVTDEHGSIVEP
ncbi:SpvB/TcaC N-terminal domain-containing protein [Amycolatopsis sp., V23-08]|uniref:SpvB/TcaC N-terminal domain-containing protein n=1 Tax=Amycolatopsis heterodermiae TaxID=3110235 RepID=A0ABU5QZ26_9PSEU|nr:SpvB/TcaC N-terminal domain-containing protein [Amycolatopsis sp., V23-08]MEA5359148.1 SpvB/TcaC N-terminal domain-containing protein [Amycolatopsis sp., V23-08]